MALTVHVQNGSYQFNGPHATTGNIADQSGVYVITTKTARGVHKVLDAGESATLQSRLNNHDRKDEWTQHAIEGLYASAYYCEERLRMAIEAEVRAFHAPPCGVR